MYSKQPKLATVTEGDRQSNSPLHLRFVSGRLKCRYLPTFPNYQNKKKTMQTRKLVLWISSSVTGEKIILPYVFNIEEFSECCFRNIATVSGTYFLATKNVPSQNMEWYESSPTTSPQKKKKKAIHSRNLHCLPYSPIHFFSYILRLGDISLQWI